MAYFRVRYKIAAFNKLSQQKFPVMGSKNPILQKIDKASSLDNKNNIAEQHMKLLGKGSSRKVYNINDKYVLKLAIDEKGLAQNLEESKPEMQNKITNNILMADPKGAWIITYFATPITEEEFEKQTNLDFKAFGEALLYKLNQESEDWPKPNNYEEINDNKFFQDIVSLVTKFDLVEGDIIRLSSFGLVRGVIKLVDFGLNRDIYEKYYQK